MLRITQIRSGGPITLKFEGKILAAWVDEIRHTCSKAEFRTTPPSLDLSDVSYVDQAGADLLREFIRDGAHIASCSSFVAEILHTVKP